VPSRPTRIPFAQRHDIAFIGGYGHMPNQDAARWLIGEIMPLVQERDPTIKCLLVGSEMPDNIRKLCDDRVVAAGHVADLADVFDQVRLTIAPLTYGAGIKGKVLESLAAGVPCVCTPIAAEGLDLPQTLKACIADSATALADAVTYFHGDEAANAECARAGLDYIAAEFSDERLDALMQQVIGRLRG
jgi:glycosyltransferase involved in cell wall biosynthesis